MGFVGEAEKFEVNPIRNRKPVQEIDEVVTCESTKRWSRGV